MKKKITQFASMIILVIASLIYWAFDNKPDPESETASKNTQAVATKPAPSVDKQKTSKRVDSSHKKEDKASKIKAVPEDEKTKNGVKGNQKIEDFYQAKRHLYGKVHHDRQKTFYCACDYANKKINHQSCDYKVRADKERAARVEAEHIVPASLFGRKFKAWTDGHPDCPGGAGKFGGRDCVRKVSKPYRLMESDLYNLQPSVGEVNKDRGHKYMAEVRGNDYYHYGSCDIKIAPRRVEPAKSIRGDIARTYFYMDWAYDKMTLDPRDKKRFEAWAKADPVDKWELERAKRIAKVQGNHNPFVIKPD